MSDSIIGKETLSFRKKRVAETTQGPHIAQKIQFAHKFVGGEKSFSLLNLTTPSAEMPGFMNPSPSQLAGTGLNLNPSALKLSLSRKKKKTVITDWESWYPTAIQGWDSISNAFFKKRQVGDSWEVQADFTVGNTNGSTAFLQLPGANVDFTKVREFESIIGEFQTLSGVTQNFNQSSTPLGWMGVDSASPNCIFFSLGNASNLLYFHAGNAISTTGNHITLKFKVPIAGLTAKVDDGYTTEPLVPFETFKAMGTTIALIGAWANGVEADAIIFGEVDALAANPIVVGDAKYINGTASLAVGQTTVNVGDPYKVGVGLISGSQVGHIKVYRNGTIQYRNIGNVAAAPNAPGNYQEIDAGNGYGTMIVFNNPPSGVADSIYFEIGTKISHGNLQVFSEIERLQGSVLKLSQDVALGLGNQVTDYISASPSEMDRRAFGDLLLSVQSDLKRLLSPPSICVFKNGAFSFSTGNNVVSFDGGELANKASVTGNNIYFSEPGIYMATANFRSTADLWNKWYTIDSLGAIVGDGQWMGSGPNFPNTHTWFFKVTGAGNYQMVYWTDGGDSVIAVAPANSGWLGNSVRTLQITITKVRD